MCASVQTFKSKSAAAMRDQNDFKYLSRNKKDMTEYGEERDSFQACAFCGAQTESEGSFV